MAPPPPSRPSAADGYRRLVGRPIGTCPTAVALHDAAAVAAEEPPAPRGRPRSSRRAMGAVRMLGMVMMLAIVVGTSVNLASADTADVAKQPTANEPASTVVADDTDAQPKDTAAVAKAEPAAIAVPASSAAVATSAAELPLTGPVQLPIALLIGAAFVLTGMFAQIAGQRPSARRMDQLARAAR